MEYAQLSEEKSSAQELRSIAVKTIASPCKTNVRMDLIEKLIFLCILALGKRNAVDKVNYFIKRNSWNDAFSFEGRAISNTR